MIPPPTRTRNALVSALVVMFILAMTSQPFDTFVQAQALAVLTPTNSPQSAAPGSSATFTFNLTNNSGADRIFSFSVSNLPTTPSGFSSSVPASTLVLSGTTQMINITIAVPTGAIGATYSNIQITATSSSPSALSVSTFVTLTVTGPTVTPTLTQTPSLTPTATTRPTSTPTPTPQGCPETDDPGSDPGGATLLLVNVSQRHGICAQGDIDFFKFGGIGGKVYTIDISQMDSGLDLSLDLYDDQGRLLTSNDDFFQRTPTVTISETRDLRPRIESVTLPYDGYYYIQVRDTLNVGGDNHTYTIIVLGESYGPTPATITEICRDLFEEDGLPEEATLITSNEVQPGHVLCPTGDADWVQFFAKAGKTYYLYTDSRNYTRDPEFNNNTQAGADTVLYLMDRDGVSLITFNDDIASSDPSLSSLDSEVRFVPSVDGFYYAQVKNVGDIGNQFIRYDLVLKLCLPGDECGRGPKPTDNPPSNGGGNGGNGTNPTSTPPTFGSTPTPTSSPTPTTESAAAQLNALDSALVNGPVKGFVDSAFERVWARSDQIIAEQRANRSWLWGPRGLMARAESYAQAPNGLRQVEYFDKARMEINNALGDRSSRWFVTTGLLVMELISGRAQVGDNDFIQREPADIPIAGDADDLSGPTYASFAGVSGQAAADRSGQIPAERINRTGQVSPYSGPARSETRLAHYVPETSHNIAQVFWNYLNTHGLIYEAGSYRSAALVDWVFTLGYPISEPYWTSVRVSGVEREVLVQVFQRRVLTYSPDNPAGWQVEMGNVGRHYYVWRYGEQLPS